MGEIANMMLEGSMCEECGDVFDDVINGDEPPGHPRKCAACAPSVPRRIGGGNAAKAARHNRERRALARQSKPHECPECGKLFKHDKSVGQHINDAHRRPTLALSDADRQGGGNG